MRITTLNVNGIRSAHNKGFWSWITSQDPDVICLQEIKAKEHDIPDELRTPKGYHAFFHPAAKPGYSGVAIYSKQKPDRVQVGMQWDEMDAEGRYLQADFGKLSVVSLYMPSGSSGDVRQQIKFQFLDRFGEQLKAMKRKKRDWVLCGDFNIAHKEIDIKNWKGNLKNSGFLPEERQWMTTLFDDIGYVDAFRQVNPDPDQFTWWSNRGQAYVKNVGWRIDYHVVSPTLRERIKGATIYKDQKFSDHAPLTIDYDYDF
jgi:exodeoxyribonuclease-3